MFCSQCGKKIDDASVCPYCGYAEPSMDVQPMMPEQPVPEQSIPVQFMPGQPAPEQPVPMPYPPQYPQYPQDQQYPQPGMTPPMPEEPIAPMNYDMSAPAPVQPKKRTGMIIGIIAAAVVVLAGIGVLVFFLTAPMRGYDRAMKLKESGSYQEAIEIFTELGDYEDSADQITDCEYLTAVKLMNDGDYDKAIEAFTALKGYKDSGDQITECRYLSAKKLMDAAEYDQAIEALTALKDYKDCPDLIHECNYQKAEAYVAEGKHSEALELYTALEEYKDSADKVNLCNYEIAKKDYDAGEFEKAAAAFEALGDYKDSKEMLKASNYAVAKSKMEKKPAEAIALLEKLGDYSDSKSLLQTAKMNYCKLNKNNTDKNTYKYLTELKKAKYKGAEDLYKELYTWKISETFWNTNKDNTDKSSAVKKIASSKTACLHFKVTGGTPGEKATFTYVAKYPNGQTTQKSFTTTDNPNWTVYFQKLSAGTLTVTIKNKSGKEVAKSSVTITK